MTDKTVVEFSKFLKSKKLGGLQGKGPKHKSARKWMERNYHKFSNPTWKQLANESGYSKPSIRRAYQDMVADELLGSLEIVCS